MRVFNGLLTSNWALGFPKYTTGFQSHALVFIIFSGCATLESNFGRRVIIRRDDVMDIGRIGLARLGIEFREIVLSGIQAIGSARVHRWTLHTDPAAFCYEARNENALAGPARVARMTRN
jgi:hypothetical protein